jgi:quercetin dioxygenase-like cupin family protein
MASIIARPAYHLAAGAGLADLWWKSGRISVKLTGAETGGAFAQVESVDPQGSGPPLHVHHNEEETFHVLDGELSVFVDGEELRLSVGDYVLVPARRRPRVSGPLGAGADARLVLPGRLRGGVHGARHPGDR